MSPPPLPQTGTHAIFLPRHTVQIQLSMAGAGQPHGFFLDSCFHHGYFDRVWPMIAETFARWYDGRDGSGRHFQVCVCASARLRA